MNNWDGIYKTRGEVQIQVLPRVRRMMPFLKQNKVRRVLDLGCGTGRHTVFLAQHGFDVTAIDISEAALAITGKKLIEADIQGIKLVRHDMEALPFSNGYFDAVVCMGVLTHGVFAKIRRTVNEIRRITRRHGFFIADVLSVRDPDYGLGREIEPGTFLGLGEEEDMPHHYYSKKEIIDLFSAFDQLRVRHMTRRITYKKRKNQVANWDIFAVV